MSKMVDDIREQVENIYLHERYKARVEVYCVIASKIRQAFIEGEDTTYLRVSRLRPNIPSKAPILLPFILYNDLIVQGLLREKGVAYEYLPGLFYDTIVVRLPPP